MEKKGEKTFEFGPVSQKGCQRWASSPMTAWRKCVFILELDSLALTQRDEKTRVIQMQTAEIFEKSEKIEEIEPKLNREKRQRIY